MKYAVALIFVLPLTLVSGPTDARAADLAPIDPALAAALAAVPSDPEPDALTRDTHYWVCNEDALDLFEPHIRGLGGALIGVGTDQNFVFAGWAKTELLVLMDFDQSIGDLHRGYRAAFETAESPQAFLALWSRESLPQMQAAITAMYPDTATQKRVQRAFKTARGGVLRRLEHTLKFAGKKGLRTFLDDPDQYAHVRALWKAGRVSIHRGDLTKRGTLQAIGQALRAHGQLVRIFYPSNAEQYFDYGPAYRENLRALPIDARSVVIRTLGWGELFGRADGTYHYTVQPTSNFLEWLADPKVKHAGRMLRFRTPSEVEGFSQMTQRPGPDARPAPNRKLDDAVMDERPTTPP
jgi:hypothetical protein